jgi:hypothetical protein
VIVCISCARTIGCVLLLSFARGDDRSLHASCVASNRRLLDQPCLGTCLRAYADVMRIACPACQLLPDCHLLDPAKRLHM